MRSVPAQRRAQDHSARHHGLGAGSKSDKGRVTPPKWLHSIREAIAGAHMLFITAGRRRY
jgi:cell division GTPase FtsZ